MGVLIGVVDLETEFYPTAAIWRSNTILLFGCLNGVLYCLDFEHRSRRPIGVCPMLKPFKSPICALAFDTFRNMLAIGYGGKVSIYVQADETSTESWGCVDHILAPCAGPAGLVTALCFFGTNLSRRHLFIGHAKAGWIIWLAPWTYNRTPFTQYGHVCSIGSATIPPSRQFIAVSTLDNSVVTYLLGEGGPDMDTQFEVKPQDPANYCPALPIVLTSSELVLKGTTIGDIDVLDTRTNTTMSLHHAQNHIIRTLNAHSDKVVVGLSDLTEGGTGSHLQCYTVLGGAEPQDWCWINNLQGLIFEITFSSMLPFSKQFALRDLGIFGTRQVVWLKLGRNKSLVFFLFAFSILLLALASDHPSRILSISTQWQSIQIAHTSNFWSTTPSQNPTLSALISWCAGYVSTQVSEWGLWLAETVSLMVKLVSFGGLMVIKGLLYFLSLFTHLLFLVPRLLKDALNKVPDLLANFICNILRMYGFNDVCPE